MDGEEVSFEALKEMIDEPPIVRVVNLIISQAINDAASAIHIDPGERESRVRYRVDGLLHEVMNPPRHVHLPVTARLKVMAGLDMAERRIPQDGKILLTHDGKKFDLRVSVLPCAYGEKVVLRIQPSESMLALEELGFAPSLLADWRALLQQPRGLILVSGPSGSGKSTTLRASLAGLESAGRSLLSIEDPVGPRLPGVSQVQVNNRVGLTVGSALRSALRADPEVVMVGLLHGSEAAALAVDAAGGRCLVLAGCYHYSAAGAVEQLLHHLGIEPYLVAMALRGSLHQRLVRRVCPECKLAGCDRCKQAGYRGQLGVQELLRNSPALSHLMQERATGAKLHELACQEGMVPLREDGQRKVDQGLTTLEELLRAVRE